MLAFAFNASARALVVVGFFGAFTTFSYETVEALRAGAPHIAFLNVAISVLFGLAKGRQIVGLDVCWFTHWPGWNLSARLEIPYAPRFSRRPYPVETT